MKDLAPNRRAFHRGALIAATATAASTRRVLGANNALRLGFIGVGNRGCQLLRAFQAHADAQVVALCDIYAPYLHADYAKLDPRFKELGSRIPKMDPVPDNVDRVTDFRRILDRDDIDAVVIATPDHWHAIQAIAACKAGKHVYVEKPLSVTIREGRAMVDAARTHDRIVQVGTHRRSSRLFLKLAELVHSGAIGELGAVRLAYATNMTPNGIGKPADGPVPEGLDWDAWLGPRPSRPFNPSIMPYKFRWHHLYSSQMGNWGVHYFDLMRILTGVTAPTTITALGGRYLIDDLRTIPDTAVALFEHEQGLLTSFCLYESSGTPVLPNGAEIELRGTTGTLYANTKGYEIVPERGGQFQDPTPRRKPETGTAPESDSDLDRSAARDFLDNVRDHKRPAADIEEGHRSTCYAHLANIALAARSRLEWDAQAERFTNNEEANALLHYEYRAPWTLE